MHATLIAILIHCMLCFQASRLLLLGVGGAAATGTNHIVRVQPATPGSNSQGTCALSTPNTTMVCQFSSLPTIGNTIVVWCFANINGAWSTPTDNQVGNTYNNIAGATVGATGVSVGVWWSKVVGSTGTFQVHCNSASALLTGLLMEYSGTQTVTPIDVSGGGSGSGTSMSPGAITTTNANDVVISGCVNTNTGGGTAVFTPVAGYAIENLIDDDNNFVTAADADNIITSTGIQTASMTYSISSANLWACGVISIKST